ncbi:hypothetical protein H0H87_001871, partial [Tephrocybe sp. NHM501043]
ASCVPHHHLSDLGTGVEKPPPSQEGRASQQKLLMPSQEEKTLVKPRTGLGSLDLSGNLTLALKMSKEASSTGRETAYQFNSGGPI